jgi:hypothetical protein
MQLLKNSSGRISATLRKNNLFSRFLFTSRNRSFSSLTDGAILINYNEDRLSMESKKREVVMEREEIVILDEGIDDSIDTDIMCCFFLYLPFRS